MGLKFWPKVIFFGSMKDAEIFLGCEKKKTEGFFWFAKKGLMDFFGYAKKSNDFFGQINSEVVIFLDINMNLCRVHLPSLIFLRGAPG